MRNELARLITAAALADDKFVVLSGDHGYALFDSLRKARPDQFVNVGVMEQAMIGIAAGLVKTGFRPLVYGLAAFTPIRVLEQIKLDICFPNYPVIFLGDGAGLVYSTLGASHQCAEDLACLRPLPNLRIYSPADAGELTACFGEALGSVDHPAVSPAYLRIGKADRPGVNTVARPDTQPYWIHAAENASVCLVAAGSMVAIAAEIAREQNLAALSIPRIKPFHPRSLSLLERFSKVIVIEEHSRYGGLSSTLAEHFATRRVHPVILPVCLEDRFSEHCGSYQYALSEHQMSDDQLRSRIKYLAESK